MRHVEVAKLERFGGGPNGEIEKGLLPLAVHEIAQLDGDPDFPERGQIRFVMGGGR